MIKFLIIKNFLICLVGLPASGKSTFANLLKSAFIKRFDNLEVKIIDPDIIRQELTSNKFNHEKEYIVRNKNLEIIKRELKKGNIVISDDLNYYSSMRHNLKEIADDLKLHFFIIYIATPITVCLKWNEERGAPIPRRVIKKIHDKFDMFNRYSWDNPFATYDLSEIIDLNLVIKEFLVKLENTIKYRKQNMRMERAKIISNEYNENLDKITRNYVGKLLMNPNFNPLKKQMFKLRKSFIKKNKNKALTEIEILNSFKIYLEKILKIDIS